MDTYTIMILAVIGIGVALGVTAVSFYRRSEGKFEEMLAGALAGLTWDEKQKTFEWQGLNFRYERYPGSKNSPPSFSVLMECAGSGGGFDIWQESAWERFFKNIGMTREIQTGDEMFDRRFYIDSSTPPYARECLAVSGKREAVRRLFDMKAASVTYGDKLLAVKWTGSLSHSQGVSHLRDAIEALAVLARDLPPYHEPAPSSEVPEIGRPYRPAVIALAIVSLVFGVISLIAANTGHPPLDPWTLFFFTLKFSLPALGVFLFFDGWAMAGHSRSHRDFLLTGFAALAGFLLLGYGAAGLYNGMGDTAAPSEHAALVLNKEVHTSKNSRSYHLYVQSWRAGRGSEDLRAGYEVYQKMVPGKDRILVRTKPGKLGFEWRVSWNAMERSRRGPEGSKGGS